MNIDMHEKETRKLEVITPGEPLDKTQGEAEEELEEAEDRQEEE